MFVLLTNILWIQSLITQLATETVQQVEAAQKHLLKAQKKGKRERADAVIQKLKSGWLPEDYLGVITDELIDRVRNFYLTSSVNYSKLSPTPTVNFTSDFNYTR